MPLIRIKVILFFMLIALEVSGQEKIDKTINFSIKEQTIPDALFLLSERADVNIVFSAAFFKNTAPISLEAKNQLPTKILKNILSQTDFTFKEQGRSILIYQRPPRYFLISGYVKDQKSGEALSGATILNQATGQGVLTNGYGYYCIKVKEGEVPLTFSYVGYDQTTLTFKVSKKIKREIALKPSIILQEIVVLSSLGNKFLQENPNQHNLLTKKLNTLVAPGGEPDLLRQLQMLPGVQSGADGFGGLHVRGGNADQNLILLDDVPVFNPSHSAGLFSIFNSSLIKQATLSKGGFSAKYGGRLSSVVDVRTKEGSAEKISGSIELGLLAATATIELPIIKQKLSFIGGIRRSYLDGFLNKRSQKNKLTAGITGQTGYHFFDVNAKFNTLLSDKDRLYISFYGGGDSFSDNSESMEIFENNFSANKNFTYKYDWGNYISSLRWNHLYNDRLFSNITIIFSRFNYTSIFEEKESIINSYGALSTIDITKNQFNSNIKEFAIRSDFDYFLNDQHKIKVGGGLTRRAFTPTIATSELATTFVDSMSTFSTPIDLDSIVYSGLESYLYLSDEWRKGDWFINIGLHAAFFNSSSIQRFSLQPRLSVKYSFTEKTAISTSGAKMTQFLHLLTTTDAGLPNDLWVPATARAEAENSWVSTLGFHQQLGDKWLLNTELYLKKLSGLITFSDTFKAQSDRKNIDANTWEDLIQIANGKSKGWELLLEKHKGNPTGWVSYTLSKTSRTILGKHKPYSFDSRHNLYLQLNYDISDWLSLNWNWTYQSGLPAINLQQLKDNFLFVDLFDSKEIQLEKDRLPAYQRMDMGIVIKLNNTLLQHQLSLGVYNLYNQKNAFLTYPTGDSESNWIRINSFPIMPSFRYVLSFK